jgi:hypothetical protein
VHRSQVPTLREVGGPLARLLHRLTTLLPTKQNSPWNIAHLSLKRGPVIRVSFGKADPVARDWPHRGLPYPPIIGIHPPCQSADCGNRQPSWKLPTSPPSVPRSRNKMHSLTDVRPTPFGQYTPHPAIASVRHGKANQPFGAGFCLFRCHKFIVSRVGPSPVRILCRDMYIIPLSHTHLQMVACRQHLGCRTLPEADADQLPSGIAQVRPIWRSTPKAGLETHAVLEEPGDGGDYPTRPRTRTYPTHSMGTPI